MSGHRVMHRLWITLCKTLEIVDRQYTIRNIYSDITNCIVFTQSYTRCTQSYQQCCQDILIDQMVKT